MSKVTDIILITSTDDCGNGVNEMQGYLKENHNNVSMRKVSALTGGNKHFQADVYMAAINHLDVDKFLSLYDTVVWENVRSVQLMLKEEEDDIFTIY